MYCGTGTAVTGRKNAQSMFKQIIEIVELELKIDIRKKSGASHCKIV
jgi:hypothetical protein